MRKLCNSKSLESESWESSALDGSINTLFCARFLHSDYNKVCRKH